MAWTRLVLAGVVLIAATTQLWALDTLKVAVGGHGNWDSAPAELGRQAGFFEKEGLALDILFTAGSGETLQAVVSGSADLGVALGTGNVMAAYLKGAPIRLIGAVATGTKDVYWYVRSDSPIKRFKDAKPQTTIAYSTTGSSTFVLAQDILKEYQALGIPTRTGGPQSTLTQVMSGQIDIGYATAPFGLKQVSEGQVRIIGNGSEIPGTRDQTVRVIVANSAKLTANPAIIERFMRAYARTVDWMYSNPKAIELYSAYSDIPIEVARQSLRDFYSKEMHDPYRVSGLEAVMSDSVRLKLLATPLTHQQLSELVQVPGTR